VKALLLATVLAGSLLFGTAIAQPPVNINTATQAELQALPGIGPAKAQAIIDHRTKQGPFKSLADLDKVKGFGKATIDKLAPRLTVGTPPAAPPATRTQ